MKLNLSQLPWNEKNKFLKTSIEYLVIKYANLLL